MNWSSGNSCFWGISNTDRAKPIWARFDPPEHLLGVILILITAMWSGTGLRLAMPRRWEQVIDRRPRWLAAASAWSDRCITGSVCRSPEPLLWWSCVTCEMSSKNALLTSTCDEAQAGGHRILSHIYIHIYIYMYINK